jgi:hypothetical protein
MVRRAAESIPGERSSGAKEGAQIKKSGSGMSVKDRFPTENTRVLATAKIGPKSRWHTGPSCSIFEVERRRNAVVFFFFLGAGKTLKKCYNKSLD